MLRYPLDMPYTTIPAYAMVKEVVSPGRFARIMRDDPRSVILARTIPPRLGRHGDFGKIYVERRVRIGSPHSSD